MNWYVHADGLGSITVLTNTSGTIVQTYSYDSFGNITSTGNVSQPFTYTGREYDSETGMYFYRARYYDPKVGRFVTKDPIGFAGGDYNLYAYVKNNSVNWIDPEGLSPAVNPNKPFQPQRQTLEQSTKTLKEYYKKKMRQELIKKCSTYVEKKALQSLVSKISGIAGIVGGILFPDSLNEGEDEMIKQLYCNKCENKI